MKPSWCCEKRSTVSADGVSDQGHSIQVSFSFPNQIPTPNAPLPVSPPQLARHRVPELPHAKSSRLTCYDFHGAPYSFSTMFLMYIKVHSTMYSNSENCGQGRASLAGSGSSFFLHEVSCDAILRTYPMNTRDSWDCCKRCPVPPSEFFTEFSSHALL